MEAQLLPVNQRGTHPKWMRYGLSCMFLILAFVRILDNGLAAPGWIADILFAVMLLIAVPRMKKETLSNYLSQPRTAMAVCLFLVAIAVTIVFDLPHIWAK